jgi:hypothetical protein
MITIEDNFQRDTYTRFIYSNPNSLSKELCSEIISKYEESKEKYDGMTLGGVNRDVKYTKDLILRSEEWDRITSTLRNELHLNLKTFLKQLNNVEDFKSSNNHSTYNDFRINFPNITTDSFMAQKYTANQGRYVYHNDSMIEWDNKRKRFMTYLWYLNDVTEGGETVFDGKYQVKPTAGKLILFPASWTFPHCGKMPVSSDKYIITGWIYTTEHS